MTEHNDPLTPNDSDRDLVAFFRDSPLAEAMAAGEVPPEAFERQRDMPRDVDFGEEDAQR